MKFEVKKCGEEVTAELHSVDSCCRGPVTDQQLLAFAHALIRIVDEGVGRAEIHVPWSPEGI